MTQSPASPSIDCQLKESQLRLETILRLSPVGIGVTRLRDGMIIEFNDALLEILGYAREEVVGHTSADLDSWANPEERQQIFARFAAGEQVRDVPSSIRRKDGSIRQVRLSASLVELGGEPHMIGSLRDVTDEAAAEHERSLSEQRLHLSLAVMPITIFHQDKDLRYTFIANPLIGQPGDAIVGRFDRDLFEAHDAEVLTSIKQRVLASGVGERHEIAIQRDGRGFWFDTLVEPERGPDGSVIGVICAGADITERKQREERYLAVLEDQTEVISRYRPDGSIVYANEVYCRFFGKTAAELLGHKWHPVAHPDDIPLIEAKLATLSRENPVITIENRVFGSDQQEHWMQFVNRGLFDSAGHLHEIQSVGRDISTRKQAELELAASRTELHALFAAADRQREAQRKLISQDIHDQLGAVLTAIGFRLEALRHQGNGDPAIVAEIANIKTLLSKATQATRDICNRLRPPALDDLGLIPTCRWYLQDWSRQFDISVQSRFTQTGDELPELQSTDLFRVFQELLTNVAKHAHASSVHVTLSLGQRAIKLVITDNGCGFATVSPKQPGFGIAGMRERMARHRGEVNIASSPQGSTITIRIPREKKT